MAEQLLLLSGNPRKRRTPPRGRGGRFLKRRANPIGANPRKRKRSKRRRSNPGSAYPMAAYSANPRRRRRSNPRVNAVRMMQDALLPSVVSAGAVIGVDLGLSFLPANLAMLKTGPVRNITRAVGVVGLGMLAGQFAKPDTVRAITSGGLSIIMHDTLKGLAQQVFPQLALGEYEADMAGLGWTGYGWNPDLTEPGGVGAYLSPPDSGMGAYMTGPAPAGLSMGEDDLDY